MSVLYCSKCGVIENASMEKGIKHRHMIDNGGGWGRIKLIGNCKHCNYMYAILFHAYNIEDEADVIYVKYYANGDRYKEMVSEYEKDKYKLFKDEYDKLLNKFNLKDE